MLGDPDVIRRGPHGTGGDPDVLKEVPMLPEEILM